MKTQEIIDTIKRVVHNRNTTGAYPTGEEYWDVKVDDKIYRAEFTDPTTEAPKITVLDKENLYGDGIGTFEYIRDEYPHSGEYDGKVKIPDLREIFEEFEENNP